jgi:CheY-like chemotaxis protein
MMNPSEIRSRTALIVDDEDQLLRLMVRLLEGAGIRVWAARDGVEARQLFREHASEIDLALIDVLHPPGAGAADLLPELLAQRPDLDVILTSGDALPEALEEKLASAGGRFLRKPFAPRTLLRLLQGDDGTAQAVAAPPGPPHSTVPGVG